MVYRMHYVLFILQISHHSFIWRFCNLLQIPNRIVHGSTLLGVALWKPGVSDNMLNLNCITINGSLLFLRELVASYSIIFAANIPYIDVWFSRGAGFNPLNSLYRVSPYHDILHMDNRTEPVNMRPWWKFFLSIKITYLINEVLYDAASMYYRW